MGSWCRASSDSAAANPPENRSPSGKIRFRGGALVLACPRLVHTETLTGPRSCGLSLLAMRDGPSPFARHPRPGNRQPARSSVFDQTPNSHGTCFRTDASLSVAFDVRHYSAADFRIPRQTMAAVPSRYTFNASGPRVKDHDAISIRVCRASVPGPDQGILLARRRQYLPPPGASPATSRQAGPSN